MSREQWSGQKAQFTPSQRLISSRLLIGTGMFLAAHLPPAVGCAIADLISGLINRLKPDFYWIVYGNLRHVVGPEVDEEGVHRLVRRVFHNSARNNYDLWHLLSRGKEAIQGAVHIPDSMWTHMEQIQERGRGVLFAGIHTGNFNLSMLALATYGPEVQVLGLARPPTGGFDLMDDMRTRGGLRMTTIGLQALREAVGRLRGGGIVLTGVDRPVGDEEPTGEFFGSPALLPTGHVRLALKTGAAILVAAPYRDPERGTVVRFSPPVEMARTGDAEADRRANLERVIVWMEKFIAERPEQWAMFVPVWPE